MICHKNVKKTLTLKRKFPYNVSRHLKEAAQAEKTPLDAGTYKAGSKPEAADVEWQSDRFWEDCTDRKRRVYAKH